jgi:uncharacterized protein (TIGR00251 family)
MDRPKPKPVNAVKPGLSSVASGGDVDSAAALDLRTQGGDSLLRVRVTPKASRNEVLGIGEGALRLRIHAPPVEGAANQEARDFLASLLGRPRSSLSLERGQSSRDKVFRIEGLVPAEVAAALSRHLP